MKSIVLTDFELIRPSFESTQEHTLKWLIAAHVKAESLKNNPSSHELKKFRKEFEERLLHVGCKPNNIQKRGHVFDDFLHENWEKMKIYKLKESPKGVDLSTRNTLFEEVVDDIFEKFYSENKKIPDDIIHVSCTGYIAPSGAQKLVAKKEWGARTTVTHAYHMGCYAAIPSIRMAFGFLLSKSPNTQVDIVHTEICSLHTNPSSHEADQLVAQSLFADGFIKYSATQNPKTESLKVLSVYEQIIPKSTKAMTWNIVDWGFNLILDKKIPVLIARALKSYFEELCKKANLDKKIVNKKALFAIHPGGPKILQHIQDLFDLSDEQIKFSREILKMYGNMSSATLPHIWDTICKDPEIPSGTPIVSLAFGPGLSICGAIMEKG